MTWVKGKSLQGNKYIIESILGEGGFGITYLATNQNSQLVVVKVLKEKVSNSAVLIDKAQKNFAREAENLKQFSHPNIVKFHDFFHEEPRLSCLVIEYINGQNLANYILDKKFLSEQESLEIIYQLGAALAIIHESGILHRDIKPQNIILREENSEAVLIDFGIAREFTPDLTQSHTQFVSDYYSPIEQYNHKSKRGAYTDIYSLSATLYTALTGEFPTPAPVRAVGTELPSPKNLNPSISHRVNNAILWGMALRPQDRPQSIKDWLDLIKGQTLEMSQKPKTVAVIPSPNFNNYRYINNSISSDSYSASNFLKATQTDRSLSLKYSNKFASISTEKNLQNPISTEEKENDFDLNLHRFLTVKSIVFLSVFIATLAGGMIGYQWKISQSFQDLDDLNFLAEDGHYEECIAQVGKINRDSIIYTESMKLLNECSQRLLNQAQENYQNGKIVNGIKMSLKISQKSIYYQEAQELIDQSYKNILEEAQVLYEKKGNLNDAIDMLESIPKNIFQDDIKETIRNWKQEDRANKQFILDAWDEIDAKNWQEAKVKANSVTTAYWQKQVRAIIEKADLEIEKAKPNVFVSNYSGFRFQYPDGFLVNNEEEFGRGKIEVWNIDDNGGVLHDSVPNSELPPNIRILIQDNRNSSALHDWQGNGRYTRFRVNSSSGSNTDYYCFAPSLCKLTEPMWGSPMIYTLFRYPNKQAIVVIMVDAFDESSFLWTAFQKIVESFEFIQ